MSPANGEETAYAFHLDAEKDGFFYFRTASFWGGKATHGRDKRKPWPVTVSNFRRIMESIGDSFVWVSCEIDIVHWVTQYGWMLAPVAFAQKSLAPALQTCTCVKSPLGLFWDVEMPRRCAERRHPPKDVQERIFDRDGHRCVECGKGRADGVKLSLDHVIPFAKGGETTEWNLVALCRSCNQGHGAEHHDHLFALAGLHHGWDPQLIKGASTKDSRYSAMVLSQNILVSRCKTETLLPFKHLVGRDK